MKYLRRKIYESKHTHTHTPILILRIKKQYKFSNVFIAI